MEGKISGFDNEVVYGSNVDFSGTLPVSAQLNANGKLLIGRDVGTPNGGGTLIDAATLTAGTGVSITNAPGSITIALAGGSASFTSIALQAFTASGTYTPTAGTKYVIIECMGGGGGGGGAAASATGSSAGGGGGAGAYSRGVFDISRVTGVVIVGVGGTGGAAGANNGGNGGNTSVGILIGSSGASGGKGGANVATYGVARGGDGGGGSIIPAGTTGAAGGTAISFATGVVWGYGGASCFGQGSNFASPISASGSTPPVSSWGGGGSGGADFGGSNVARLGGAGRGGIVIFTEYI